MKKRSDFVTNSSSSSFIVVFKDEEEKNKAMQKMVNDYPDYVVRIFKDIENGKIDFDKAVKIFKEEIYNDVWGRLAFSEEYKSKGWDYILSDEFKEICNNETKERVKEFEEDMKKYGIISYVEYSDNESEMDADLEHYVMPNMFFTYMIFNHH